MNPRKEPASPKSEVEDTWLNVAVEDIEEEDDDLVNIEGIKETDADSAPAAIELPAPTVVAAAPVASSALADKAKAVVKQLHVHEPTELDVGIQSAADRKWSSEGITHALLPMADFDDRRYGPEILPQKGILTATGLFHAPAGHGRTEKLMEIYQIAGQIMRHTQDDREIQLGITFALVCLDHQKKNKIEKIEYKRIEPQEGSRFRLT